MVKNVKNIYEYLKIFENVKKRLKKVKLLKDVKKC